MQIKDVHLTVPALYPLPPDTPPANQVDLTDLGLTLVMGGALGNVIDRIRFGAVVDFIQWHAAGFYWPAFNVADSAITVGAVLLVISTLTAPGHKENPR